MYGLNATESLSVHLERVQNVNRLCGMCQRMSEGEMTTDDFETRLQRLERWARIDRERKPLEQELQEHENEESKLNEEIRRLNIALNRCIKRKEEVIRKLQELKEKEDK